MPTFFVKIADFIKRVPNGYYAISSPFDSMIHIVGYWGKLVMMLSPHRLEKRRRIMKKRMGMKTLTALGLVIVLLAFAGCGSGGGGSSTDASAEFIGTWEIVEMEEDGETTEADDLALMKEMGLNITLVLEKDEKATLNIFDETKDGTWKAKDASSCSITFDGESVDAVLADGKLTLEQDGARLVFEKASETPDGSDDDEDTAPSSAEAADNAEEVSITSDYYGFNITVKLPESNWVWMQTGNVVYFYNEPTEEDAYSDSPRIQVEVYETEDEKDIYIDDFEELADFDNRTISGIDMAGRTYKIWGMDWIEYYGKLEDTHFVSVKISGVDIDSGEGKEVLDSINVSLL